MIKLPELLVCDIDGTIAEANGNISPLLREVFEKLHEKGVVIGLASGRPLYQSIDCEKKYGLSFPFDLLITMNGASYYDTKTKKLTEITTMEKEDVRQIVELMKPYEDLCNLAVYTEDEMIVRKNDEWMQVNWYPNRKDVKVEKEDGFYWSARREKLMYRFFRPADLEDCLKELNKVPSDRFNCFRTQPDHLEFASKATDKKYALMEYCRNYGIDLQDVCACGDTTNDNGMLEVSGTGVCLKNGSDDTKRISDYITDKTVSEDGLGLFLKERYKDYL